MSCVKFNLWSWAVHLPTLVSCGFDTEHNGILSSFFQISYLTQPMISLSFEALKKKIFITNNYLFYVHVDWSSEKELEIEWL